MDGLLASPFFTYLQVQIAWRWYFLVQWLQLLSQLCTQCQTQDDNVWIKVSNTFHKCSVSIPSVYIELSMRLVKHQGDTDIKARKQIIMSFFARSETNFRASVLKSTASSLVLEPDVTSHDDSAHIFQLRPQPNTFTGELCSPTEGLLRYLRRKGQAVY